MRYFSCAIFKCRNCLIKRSHTMTDTYIDISSKLSDKLDACRCYKSQFQESLTPRSIEAVRQLALLRGSMIGTGAAEAFKTIYRKAI